MTGAEPKVPVCNSEETAFEDNLQTFQEVLRSAGRKDNTISMYSRFVHGMGETVGGKDPATWTDGDVRALMLSDTYKDWKSSTQRTARAALKSYWEVHGITAMLPPNNYYFWRDRTVSRGGSNRYDELKAKAPSQREVEVVLDVCRDAILTSPRENDVLNHMALYLAAAYGLRRIEVARLRLCDVRLDAETVHVEESKGDKSRDVYMDVPIPRDVWDRFMAARTSVLDRLRAGTEDGRVIARLDGFGERPTAPLFFARENGDVGEPIKVDAIGRAVSRLASRILGRNVNAHAFRHAKVFYLLEVKHLALQNAADYMGHTDLQMTADYSYGGVAAQRAAFKSGGAPDSAREENAQPSASDRPSEPVGRIDAPVAALTAAYSRGDLSAEAFATAVAALSSGAK